MSNAEKMSQVLALLRQVTSPAEGDDQKMVNVYADAIDVELERIKAAYTG